MYTFRKAQMLFMLIVLYAVKQWLHSKRWAEQERADQLMISTDKVIDYIIKLEE